MEGLLRQILEVCLDIKAIVDGGPNSSLYGKRKIHYVSYEQEDFDLDGKACRRIYPHVACSGHGTDVYTTKWGFVTCLDCLKQCPDTKFRVKRTVIEEPI